MQRVLFGSRPSGGPPFAWVVVSARFLALACWTPEGASGAACLLLFSGVSAVAVGRWGLVWPVWRVLSLGLGSLVRLQFFGDGFVAGVALCPPGGCSGFAE